MDEVGDERVLRVVEGGAALPSCPTCGEPVSGYEAATRTEWALKDARSAGSSGYPSARSLVERFPEGLICASSRADTA